MKNLMQLAANEISPSCCGTAQAQEPSVLESLRQKEIRLIEQLQNVQETIKILERNPDFSKAIELLGKSMRY